MCASAACVLSLSSLTLSCFLFRSLLIYIRIYLTSRALSRRSAFSRFLTPSRVFSLRSSSKLSRCCHYVRAYAGLYNFRRAFHSNFLRYVIYISIDMLYTDLERAKFGSVSPPSLYWENTGVSCPMYIPSYTMCTPDIVGFPMMRLYLYLDGTGRC